MSEATLSLFYQFYQDGPLTVIDHTYALILKNYSIVGLYGGYLSAGHKPGGLRQRGSVRVGPKRCSTLASLTGNDHPDISGR